MGEDLIDTIYEAAVNPELWPEVLDSMSVIAGAEGGVLFAARTGAPQWTSSLSMRQHMEDFVRFGWAANNTRGQASFRKRLTSFSTDHDSLTEEEIERDPLYQEFFRPRGLGWSIGTSIVPMTGDVFVVSLERRFDKGPVGEETKAALDPLRPHLARAALLSARLALERVRGTVSGLESIGLAAAVVTASGRVVVGNSLIEALQDFVSFGSFDRISFKDGVAQKWLSGALDCLHGERSGKSPPMTFPLRGELGEVAVAHVLPLVSTARDIFARGDAVLIVSTIGNSGAPDASLLEALFDLTPAECLVARKTIEGMPGAEVARELGISHETIRTHMKAIFRKTGVRRQVDLVRLVAGLPKAGSSRSPTSISRF